MRKLLFLVLFCVLLVAFTGCLSTESKEYHFKVNADGSGEGSITFNNIVSQDDEERDVSFKDFGELVTDYLEGSSFEDQNPNYEVTGKRLYEKDGKLNGEVTFKFASLDSVSFFRTDDCDCAPVLYATSGLGETLAETNGTDLNQTRNVAMISWDAKDKEYYFKTTGQEDLSNTHSLYDHWKQWKDSKK